MGILNKLIEDSKSVPQNIYYKTIKNKPLTLGNQEEALTNSRMSYYFAREYIPGSDIKALQAKACERPVYAYKFGMFIYGADRDFCFKHASKSARYKKLIK